MSYLLISSRDPFTTGPTAQLYTLAIDLRRRGHQVVLFLLENGVLAARATARDSALAETIAAGVTVFADKFSMRQRAMGAADLLHGIDAASLERIADALADGTTTIWH